VISVGARLGYQDDGQTPNTQIAYFAYEPVPLLFEVRGLPRDRAAREGDWGAGMDAFLDARIGVILHAEGGTLRIPSYTGAVAFDDEGREIRRWEGAQDHFADFIAAVRSRKAEDLAADVEQGHLSSALCHLANISHRLGGALERDAIREGLKDSAVLTGTYDRLCAHLEANEVDLTQKTLVLGPCLELELPGERFKNDERANRMLTREYREPYVLPGTV
jgi:hypothetical protein